MDNKKFSEAVRNLKMLQHDQNLTQQQKKQIGYVIWLVESGALDAEEALIEAKNIGARYPEFPGDMVGRAPNDFDE